MLEAAGIILAGGKSKRMGQDKAFLLFEQKPLIEKVIDIMRELFADIIVVSNNLKAYDKYRQKIAVSSDIIPECGPLGGIYTGLLSSRHRYNFVVGCDTPFLSRNLLSYILRSPEGFEAVVPEYDNRLQPLCALYSKDCLAHIESRINGKNLIMRNLLNCLRTKVIKEAEVKSIDPQGLSFVNINTYEEYRFWAQKFQEDRLPQGFGN